MVWEVSSFTDGQILYAGSHMLPLQDNFLAMASQDSGAPLIDVNCSASNNFNVNSNMNYIDKPFFACRAWVSFNGTLSASSMSLGGGNISSITDNGVGHYTFNFTTAIGSAYVGMGGMIDNGTDSDWKIISQTTSSFGIKTFQYLDPSTGTLFDSTLMELAFIG